MREIDEEVRAALISESVRLDEKVDRCADRFSLAKGKIERSQLITEDARLGEWEENSGWSYVIRLAQVIRRWWLRRRLSHWDRALSKYKLRYGVIQSELTRVDQDRVDEDMVL